MLVRTAATFFLSTLAACSIATSSQSFGLPTTKIAPAYTVLILNGKAHAHAELRDTIHNTNVLLNGGDELLCNGVPMATQTNSYPIVYDADIPLLPDGHSYRFELRRGTGEDSVNEIGALSVTLMSPLASTVIHPGQPLNMAWSPSTGDQEMVVVGAQVLSGSCTIAPLETGLPDDGLTVANPVPNTGSATIDGSSFAVNGSGTCEVQVSVIRNANAPIGAPFASGSISVYAKSNVSVTLAP